MANKTLDNNPETAAIISKLREEKHISSPEKLSEEMISAGYNISPSTARRIEKTGKLSKHNAKLYADFFGVTVDYLKGKSEYGNKIMQRKQTKSVHDSMMDAISALGFKIENCGIFEKLDHAPYYKPASSESVSHGNEICNIYRVSQKDKILCYVDEYEINLLIESIMDYMKSQINLMSKFRNIDSLDFDTMDFETLFYDGKIFASMDDLITYVKNKES